MRPFLLVKSGGRKAAADWRVQMERLAPHLDVRWWDDPEVLPEQVHYVVVWDPEPGRLAQLPALKVIFGSGAGVDIIAADPDLPRHLPLVRMGAPEATQRMGEYVCWAALTLLRGGKRIGLAQAEARWDEFESPHKATDRTVGIMGIGNMGGRAAAMLRGLGFPVIGWSRGRKVLPDIESYAGDAELAAFLGRTDILVCLLPATAETRGILNARLFAQLPRGAQLIQAGRGSQNDIPDILAALDDGQLSGAVIDVFEQEPLPAEHPLWRHPKAIVTAHVASLPSRAERAAYVAATIAAFERGEPLPNLYDHARGY